MLPLRKANGLMDDANRRRASFATNDVYFQQGNPQHQEDVAGGGESLLHKTEETQMIVIDLPPLAPLFSELYWRVASYQETRLNR